MPSVLPTNTIACADSLAFAAALPEACCDLIYADPPFCTGKRQTNGDHETEFSDVWAGGLDSYLDFLQPRLEQFHRILKPNGSLWLHLDWHAVHYVKVRLDALFGYDNFLNEVIWSYRTGGRSPHCFARKHDSLLVYAKQAGRHTFNVLRNGVFRTDGLKCDDNGRPYKNTRAGRLYFHPNGPAMTDVWEIPFLSTVSLERTGYPTQKPEALLERIIQASSQPDELVADFFCGSGTSLAVAQRLGRRWLGCDISPAAVDIARHRMTLMAPK